MRQTFDHELDKLGSVVMEANGLKCTLNLPPALRSQFDQADEEEDLGLPPYGERVSFLVDDFEGSPASWMRGSPREASYFVPVRAEHGLWLDFNANSRHLHQVAALVSIQGVNAVTGLPTEGALRLEQYRERCPRHNEPFGEGRFCQGCGFKWPHQNYLASTGTPRGLFWLDGFRAKDGRVRQWVFTEEMARGVAAQVIGDKRVFALGIAFFLSREPKPLPPPPKPLYRGGRLTLGGGVPHAYGLGSTRGAMKGGLGDWSNTRGPEGDEACFAALDVGAVDALEEMDADTAPPTPQARRVAVPAAASAAATPSRAARAVSQQPAKRLEVAAGARIDQEVYPDPQPLEFWQDQPAGIIYVNYVDEDTARAILQAGRIDRTARGDGFMASLTVGHPAPAKAD